MKMKYISISIIVLIALMISGGSLAWFITDASAINQFKCGTVEVEVLEPGFADVTGVVVNTEYKKNVMVKSLGTKKTYVRVRLVPQWSDPSLPVSNVILNLADNSDWIKNDPDDGYYYFIYYLSRDQTTSKLLESITFKELGPEYEGKTFTLKVVAEGVQITHNAWKKVWRITDLPFIPDQPWISDS